VLAVLAMLAPKTALRVAPGGSAPLFPSVPRRGHAAVRSGRESRLASRTGKLGWQHRSQGSLKNRLKVGQFWTPMVGQFSTPIDNLSLLRRRHQCRGRFYDHDLTRSADRPPNCLNGSIDIRRYRVVSDRQSVL
jgi:hypothetical protein